MVLLLMSFFAPAAQEPSGNASVTTVVHDYDSTGAQVLLRSDDYNGSGQATYGSFITSSGELELEST